MILGILVLLLAAVLIFFGVAAFEKTGEILGETNDEYEANVHRTIAIALMVVGCACLFLFGIMVGRGW